MTKLEKILNRISLPIIAIIWLLSTLAENETKVTKYLCVVLLLFVTVSRLVIDYKKYFISNEVVERRNDINFLTLFSLITLYSLAGFCLYGWLFKAWVDLVNFLAIAALVVAGITKIAIVIYSKRGTLSIRRN